MSKEQVTYFKFIHKILYMHVYWQSHKFKLIITLLIIKLEKFHELYSVSKKKQCNINTLIKYNDRPVCSMGDRVVQRSFE